MSREAWKDFNAIEVHDGGAIVTVRFNRPKMANAINWEMETEFNSVLETCDSDDTVKCVVLCASGRNFSAGHDIAQVAEERVTGAPPATFDGKYWARTGEMLPAWQFRKALVVAVKGYVGPHANAILLTADAVVAAEDSVFSWEENRIGIGPPYGPYTLLPFHFPLRVLKQLWMPGGWLDADTALRLSYVNRVVPLGQEEAAAQRIAEMYASMEVGALVANKKGVHALFEAAGLLPMIDIGREPYEVVGEMARQQEEHFRLIHEKGAGVAARTRDADFDRSLSQV